MAIVLKEEGIYDRTTIYATDFNQQALHRAKEGIFSSEQIKEYAINYHESGGKNQLSDYYTSKYDSVIMNQDLKKNIVWANHNLVTDSVFSEVHVVLCRNVLIYFDKALQNKVQKLFSAFSIRRATPFTYSRDSPVLRAMSGLEWPLSCIPLMSCKRSIARC